MQHKRGARYQRIILLVLAAIPAAYSCGGGATPSDTAPPSITRVNGGLSTVPSPITRAGGTATVTVDVTDSSGVDPNSVKADVTRGGVSIIGGPQAMYGFNSNQNRYYYQASLPANSNNAADDIYTFTVTAADLKGNRVNPAFNVGTVTVPNR